MSFTTTRLQALLQLRRRPRVSQITGMIRVILSIQTLSLIYQFPARGRVVKHGVFTASPTVSRAYRVKYTLANAFFSVEIDG